MPLQGIKGRYLHPYAMFIKKEGSGGKQRVGNLKRLSTGARQ